jgi:hypothetical protein
VDIRRTSRTIVASATENNLLSLSRYASVARLDHPVGCDGTGVDLRAGAECSGMSPD